MTKLRVWILALSLSTSAAATAQDVDPLLSLSGESVFTEQDSLSIFTLIDSLMNMDITLGSQLALRVGYNSNVLSAGRTLGIENFGLTPAVTYYHKSGFYADLAGYWSKDFSPSYYLTIGSLGYMHDFSKHISVMASYDRYFYNLPEGNDYVPYKNTFSITPIVEFKPVMLSLNYSFYLGDQQANRFMPGLGFRIQKKKFLGLDRVTLLPTFYLLVGDEQITTIDYIDPKNIREAIENFRAYGTRYRIEQTTRNVSGIMNYTLSLPLSITYHQWNLLVTYGYSIPRALPGEALSISESSYLTGSLTYFIDLSRNKKPL